MPLSKMRPNFTLYCSTALEDNSLDCSPNANVSTRPSNYASNVVLASMLRRYYWRLSTCTPRILSIVSKHVIS